MLLAAFWSLDRPTPRARLCERREAKLRMKHKPKRIAKFIDGRFVTGTDTAHRTRSARLWRVRVRLASQRVVRPAADWMEAPP